MDKSLYWSLFSRPIRVFMWIVRNGKRQNQNNFKNKGGSYMSGLWKQVLEQLRIWGNHSGCHQLPERSFFYKGKQFPICARCTGVVLGQLSAVLYSFFESVPFLHCVLLISAMGIDWLLQETKIRESTNLRRLITGFCGGFGLFSIYIISFKKAKSIIT